MNSGSVAVLGFASALLIGAAAPIVGADLLVLLHVIAPLDLIRFARP